MYNHLMNIDDVSLENLSDRLNYALQITRTKKADLARSIAVKPQIIQFLCNSKTQSSRFTFEIATVLGLNTRWLATGEGSMFIADDPKQQFLKTYQSIPVLRPDNIKKVFLHENALDFDSVQDWLPLKTEDKNTFAIEMNDASMEPYFPLGSYVFIEKCSEQRIAEHKYVFSYLAKCDTFIVRELVETNLEKMLMPINMELFNGIKVTENIKLLGIITHCFWHTRS